MLVEDYAILREGLKNGLVYNNSTKLIKIHTHLQQSCRVCHNVKDISGITSDAESMDSLQLTGEAGVYLAHSDVHLRACKYFVLGQSFCVLRSHTCQSVHFPGASVLHILSSLCSISARCCCLSCTNHFSWCHSRGSSLSTSENKLSWVWQVVAHQGHSPCTVLPGIFLDLKPGTKAHRVVRENTWLEMKLL